jgi:hypothetical protein
MPLPPFFFYRVYRIHPGIGVSRIGNSSTEDETEGYFIGPEVPEIGFVPPGGKYRDDDKDIKRQGSRFRIYEYTYVRVRPPLLLEPHPTPGSFVREITSDEAEIEWHVHLANLKSKDANGHPVANDPGEKSIGGLNKSLDVTGSVLGANVQLGTLKTDDKGRLIVLGGFGKSASPLNLPITGLFNNGWYDDVSDGSVRATVTMRGTGAKPAIEPAWVIVGVSRFAEPVSAIVTMYDLAYDVATHLPPPNTLVPPATVSFTRDIYPVLLRPVMMQWVNANARTGHSGAAGANFMNPAIFDLLKNNDPNPASPASIARNKVFGNLKPNPGADMPLLSMLQVTGTQFDLFKQWAAGNFLADWGAGPPLPPPPVKPFDQLTPLEQTHSLDMTGLWTAVGGAFFPGIEAGSAMTQPSTYGQPFRIRSSLPPGSLTQTLSVPWQSDYHACGDSWWPSGRPDEVTQDGTTFYNWIPSTMTTEQLVTDWWKLGFLFKKAPDAEIYVERERLI